MPVLRLSIAALALGSVPELERLVHALEGPGFFTCEELPPQSSDVELFVEGYRASRRLLRRPFERGVATHYATAEAAARASPCGGLRKPQRWWFTVVRGKQWSWADGHPGVERSIRSLDAWLAGVAAILAAAIAGALRLPCGSLEASYKDAMLRARRYPPASAGIAEGLEAHVDYGDFTLCHGDEPGLEVRNPDSGVWCPLPSRALHFLAGQGLATKAEGRVHPALHRVRLLERSDRFSFCRQHGISQ